MKRKIQFPPWKAIAPDLLALALGLALAWFLDWQTTDLVWSLWLGSLVLGYLTILSTIAAGVYVGLNAIFHPEFPKARRPLLLALGAAGALFLLGFFSLHFCAFHAGHAGFLSLFFPLEGMPPDASASSTSIWISTRSGTSAPRHSLGRNGLIGVTASSGAPSGMIGPWAERL